MVNKKTFRIELAISSLARELGADLHFLTLTTPDVCKLREVCSRWRMFRNSRYFKGRGIRFVMVFEKHPNGHGWHIHAIINQFLPVYELRAVCTHCGFGRIRIDRCSRDIQALKQYLGKYVSKSLRARDDEAKGVRLVNVSRGLPILSDISVTSEKLEFCRSVLASEYSKFASSYRLLKASAHIYMVYPYCRYDYLRSTLGLSDDVIRGLLKFFESSSCYSSNDGVK